MQMTIRRSMDVSNTQIAVEEQLIVLRNLKQHPDFETPADFKLLQEAGDALQLALEKMKGYKDLADKPVIDCGTF